MKILVSRQNWLRAESHGKAMLLKLLRHLVSKCTCAFIFIKVILGHNYNKRLMHRTVAHVRCAAFEQEETMPGGDAETRISRLARSTPFLDGFSFEVGEAVVSTELTQPVPSRLSPFLSVYETAGQPDFRDPEAEARAAFLNEIHDDEFDEALWRSQLLVYVRSQVSRLDSNGSDFRS
jgi:hypothetical protein